MKLSIEDAHALTIWYDKNKRDLPWRDTGNPYDVWISEIMLQQTRIEAVKPKFALFKENFPDISSLAVCSEDHLLRVWEGLGYYSRARNLRKCAIVLAEKYDGKLPQTYEELLSLPGIGPYTAGAIASIAYGQKAAAADGNVLRVLARCFADKRDIRDIHVHKEYTNEILDLFERDPSLSVSSFNQGLMELGEVICLPNGAPQCHICPLSRSCKAYLYKCTDTIPCRSSLKQRKIVNRTLLVIRDNDSFVLHKRKSSGLLASLYEFIGIDGTITKEQAVQEAEKLGFTALHIKQLPSSKHVFTHLEWHMQAFEIQTAQITSLPDETYRLSSKKELTNMAVPSAFKTYIQYYSLRD